MWLRNVSGRAALGLLGTLAAVGALWAAELNAEKSNPYLAREGSTPEQLVKYLEKMRDKPQTIRLRSAFQAAVIDAADRLLAEHNEGDMFRAAVMAKFATLHEAAVEGNEKFDVELVSVSKTYADNKDEEVAAAAEFYLFERRILDSTDLPIEERAKLLDEAEKYLTGKKLGDQHLRMASTLVTIINDLPKDEDALKKYELFGNLFAKSSDRAMKFYGEKIAKGPGGGGGGQNMPTQGPRPEFAGKPIELSGVNSSGEEFSWDKYKDKVVLVDFWASWCGPCLAMFPELMKIKADYADQGFAIVGVTLDKDLEKLRKFAEGREIPWEMIIDQMSDMKLAKHYKIQSIPHVILVDRNGNVVAEKLHGPALRAKIEELLKAKPGDPTVLPSDEKSDDKDTEKEEKGDDKSEEKEEKSEE